MKEDFLTAWDPGLHNADLKKTIERLKKEGAYKDQSSIIIVPAFGTVPTKIAFAWRALAAPPNQFCHWLGAVGFEVGEAYNAAIEGIIGNPALAKCKYIITMEHDNFPQPFDLVNLLRSMENNPQYAAISGLYWTKGYGGQPQIWGDPKDPILNYRPQLPDINGGLVECCGLGMGFVAYRMSMFKDEKLRKPWFKTSANSQDGVMTQDLYAWKDFRAKGYRCAVDCSIRIGHLDYEGKFGEKEKMW